MRHEIKQKSYGYLYRGFTVLRRRQHATKTTYNVPKFGRSFHRLKDAVTAINAYWREFERARTEVA